MTVRDSKPNRFWKAAPAMALALALAAAATSCQRAGDATSKTAADPAPIANAAVADVVDDGTQDRVAQVSLVEGAVSMLPADGDDWETVSMNEPVLEGYQVYAADDARGELLVGDGKYARFGDGAALTVSRLDPNWAQFELASGTAELALDQWTDGDYYEISAPGGALVPQRAGSYRVDVTPDGRSRVIVLRGAAQVTTPNGSFVANEGDVIDLGNQPAQVNVVSGGASGYRDAFYDWSDQRDVYYRNQYAYASPEPVRVFQGRNDIYGVLALAAFGVWQALDNDHYAWVPYDARRAGWSPYQNGHWDYAPVVGWTWVSSDAWGWAPYHYGRWDYTRYGWAWAPYYETQTVGFSSWRETYRWAPAQVYFYQPPQTNVYAWVPLAPGEPYIPYTSTLVVRDDRQFVDFRPRFLREQRAVYVVSDRDLELRARPRAADRALVAQIGRAQPQQLALARLPKPQRLVGEREVAKVKPDRSLIDRPVVVTQKSLDRPLKPATQRALAKEQRQVQKADQKTLNVDRQQVTAQNKPQPLRGKGANRTFERAANAPEAPSAQAPKQGQQQQPQQKPSRAERQAQRAQERAQQPSQATPQVTRAPRAPKAQPQQQRTPRKQQQQPRAQRERPQQTQRAQQPQRAPRVQQSERPQQPRAQAPKATRQAAPARQQQKQKPQQQQQSKGGKKQRP